MQIENYSHNGKRYEIRVSCVGEMASVKVFIDDLPANQFTYSATLEVAQDMSDVVGVDAVMYLIELAKHDVINGLQ